MPTDAPARGFTVTDASKLLRVSEEKIRRWIKGGQLSALDTAEPNSRKPRYVILPDAIKQFAAARSPAVPPKPPRRKRRTEEVDYLPHL